MRVTKAHAKKLGDKLGIDWNKVDLEQFRMGIEVEREHIPTVGNKITKFAGISRDHLSEDNFRNRKYYSRLKKIDPHGSVKNKAKKTVKRTVRKKK